jgi:hypothetical protein
MKVEIDPARSTAAVTCGSAMSSRGRYYRWFASGDGHLSLDRLEDPDWEGGKLWRVVDRRLGEAMVAAIRAAIA